MLSRNLVVIFPTFSSFSFSSFVSSRNLLKASYFLSFCLNLTQQISLCLRYTSNIVEVRFCHLFEITQTSQMFTSSFAYKKNIVCSLPPEYCRYCPKKYSDCLVWLQKKEPEIYEELQGINSTNPALLCQPRPVNLQQYSNHLHSLLHEF